MGRRVLLKVHTKGKNSMTRSVVLSQPAAKSRGLGLDFEFECSTAHCREAGRLTSTR